MNILGYRWLLIQISLLTSIFCIQFAVAQNVSWSNEYELESRLTTPVFLGLDQENIYSYSVVNDQFYLECYNRLENFRCYRNKIRFDDNGDGEITVSKVVYLDSNVWASGWSYNRKTNEYKIHIGLINPKTGKFIGSSQKTLLTQTISNAKDVGDFDLIFSPNNKRVLLYHIRTDEKLDLVIKQFKVLNTAFDQIASTKLDVPKDEYNDLGPKFIDDFGSIYGLGLDDDKIVKVISYDIEADLKERKEIINIESNSNKPNITNVKAGVSPDNEFVVLGFYLTKVPSDSTLKSKLRAELLNWEITGAVCYKKKGVSSVATTKLSLFEDKFFDKLTSKFNLAKGKAVMYNVYGNEDIIFRNNKVIFLCESKTIRSSSNYMYTDLCQVIALKFNDECELAWSQVVAKRQKITDKPGGFGYLVPGHYSDKFLSYKGLVIGDNLHIFFNDRKENAEIIKLYYIEKHYDFTNRATTIVAKLDLASGKQTKQAQYRFMTPKFICIPSALQYYEDENTLLLINQKNYSYKMGWYLFE